MTEKKQPSITDDGVYLGDVVRTRKPHPCGGDTWTVIRTGADIKLKCLTCGHVVMLDRIAFLKRRKATVSRVEATETDHQMKEETKNERE